MSAFFRAILYWHPYGNIFNYKLSYAACSKLQFPTYIYIYAASCSTTQIGNCLHTMNILQRVPCHHT
jgi:hypothetical protein